LDEAGPLEQIADRARAPRPASPRSGAA
jgi:hypothetical protein